MESYEEQGSEDWLAKRRNYIGGSDAPVIMKASIFKTPYQLWLEKFDLFKQPENSNMTKGKEMEPIIREMICNRFNDDFFPKVVFSPTHQFMMASLDGINDEGCVIEIKYANRDDHALAKTNQVPQKYFWQLQHIMECCEVDFIFYVSYNTDLVFFKVYRDQAAIDKMLIEEAKFFECMQTFTEPDKTEKDYIQRTDQEWHNAVSEYRSIKQQLDAYEIIEQEKRKRLLSLADGKMSIGGGVKVSRYMRKGNVEYGNIPELKNVNLEMHRKKPTEVWRISDN